MLNFIRNNFPKGCLFRFLTDLATKIENDRDRICPHFPNLKREENLSKIKQFTLEK
jgi:hypothetical protein